MNNVEKIDYMIQSLELAKEEIEYYEWYKNEENISKYRVSSMLFGKRNPNGTVIRESLKMVGRLANQVANECSLTVYNEKMWRNEV